MRYNHIQRFLSMAVLLAFMTPSGLAASVYDAYGSRSSAAPYVSTMSLSTDKQLTDKNTKITLSLRDSDVKQVLRMFADKAGMNIVFHTSVDGKVTLDLVDTPINDAFNLVMQISGLNFCKQNNTLIIMSKDAFENSSFSKQDMMLFPIKYISATNIANFLNKSVFKAGKTGSQATVNPATNELIVFGSPSDAPIVEKVIAQLDREPISRTYTVNHTTPAEMANLICDILLPSRGMRGGGSGGQDEQMDMVPTPGMGTGGAAGIMTGGAANAGSSSSGDGLKMGEGILACSATPASTSGFDLQGLSISYFPQRGTISMIGGTESQAAMIDKFIRENDVKQPQAYLELSIIELNEDGSKQFNNTWKIDSNNWLFSFSGSTTSFGRTATPGSRGFVPVKVLVDNGDGTFSEKDSYVDNNQWYGGRSYITWQMNYLIENKKARVLANPKLLITNGQESTIDLTQDYVEKVTSEFLSSTASGEGASGVVQRTYSIGEDKGIKITLTPFISPDGYVTMNIKPEYAVEGGTVTTPGIVDASGKQTYDLQATLLNRRNLDLKNVRIKDGETLVIGGMIQEVEEKAVQKIPVLGDLPIIGAAFRSTQTQKAKSELIIMITPNIINDGEGTVADKL